MKIALYQSCLLFLCFECIFCSECNSQTQKSSFYLGTKTPYRILQNDNRSPYPAPPDCQAVQLWMLVRHGTRYPSSSVIMNMKEILPSIRDTILECHSQGKGFLCKDELELFKTWSTQVELKDEKQLADEGEDEMKDLAERMLDRLPDLLQEEYTNHTFKFRYTDTQRTHKSAKYFADGLFGRRQSQHVWYPEALGKDPILRFYKLCTRWQEEVDDNPEVALKERQAFEHTHHFKAVQESVAKRLGFKNISSSNLELMYTTCAFETAWKKHVVSPWCSIFTENELQVLEYAEDLEYFWTDGYGFDVNYEQACPPVQHMLQSFKNAATKDLPKGIFHFTHSGALLKILAYLGLYRDKEPLLHSNFDQHRTNRAWRVSSIDSFAANIGAILYRCTSNTPRHRVLLLHQEKPIEVPGCPDMLCPLDHLLKHHPDCHFHNVCSLQSKNEEL